MPLVHCITRLRYDFKCRLKLNIRDEILERIIEFYYRIPYFGKGINLKKKKEIEK